MSARAAKQEDRWPEPEYLRPLFCIPGSDTTLFFTNISDRARLEDRLRAQGWMARPLASLGGNLWRAWREC